MTLPLLSCEDYDSQIKFRTHNHKRLALMAKYGRGELSELLRAFVETLLAPTTNLTQPKEPVKNEAGRPMAKVQPKQGQPITRRTSGVNTVIKGGATQAKGNPQGNQSKFRQIKRKN